LFLSLIRFYFYHNPFLRCRGATPTQQLRIFFYFFVCSAAPAWPSQGDRTAGQKIRPILVKSSLNSHPCEKLPKQQTTFKTLKYLFKPCFKTAYFGESGKNS